MAQASQKDPSAEVEALKKDLAQLRGDVADLLKVVKEQSEQRVRDKAETARDEVKEAFDDGMSALNRGYDQVRARGEARVDEAEELVGRHPLTSVMAAFGIGFVVAKLMDLGGRH
ncbi:MAG: YqjD family protein [Guyparkeria sp.]|uniref:DUF883 family protein n=1 Tax=Guyparkeria sp. TaxID=2035736 RepID=UPI00397CD6C4